MDVHSATAAATGCRTLWLGDLPQFADEAYLAGLFASEGVASVKLIRNRVSGLPEGYAFLEFASHEAAADVLARYNGQPIPFTECLFRLNWAAHGVGRTTPEGEIGGVGRVGGGERWAKAQTTRSVIGREGGGRVFQGRLAPRAPPAGPPCPRQARRHVGCVVGWRRRRRCCGGDGRKGTGTSFHGPEKKRKKNENARVSTWRPRPNRPLLPLSPRLC